MDKKKKTLIIGGSAGAAALVALIVVSIVLANRPSALIARGFVNTISDAKRIELFDVADDVVNGGSIAVSANLDKFAKDDLTIQAKLYSDARDMESAYEMNISEDGEPVLQTRASFNQDKCVFTCPGLVDGAYGVNIKNLAKNLPGSIFDPDEETDFSLTEEQFVYFMNLRETTKNNRNLEQDISNMTAKYRQLLIEKLVKYSDVGRSSKTITAGGEKLHCTVITLSVDQEVLALAIEDLIDYADNDKELEKLVDRIASNSSLYQDKEDFIDEFYGQLDELGESLDELKDEEIEITLDFYITSSGRRIAQIDAELEAYGDDVEISLILGKNVAKSNEISLTARDKRSQESYSIVYTVAENSSSYYEASIEIKEVYGKYSSGSRSDADKSVIKIEWDRRGGDFKFDYKDSNDERYIVKGNLIQKGDKYIFVLTNLRAGFESVPSVKSLEFTITVDRHDPVPNLSGRYTDVTRMEKREFKHLVEDISDGFNDLWEEYF